MVELPVMGDKSLFVRPSDNSDKVFLKYYVTCKNTMVIPVIIEKRKFDYVIIAN